MLLYDITLHLCHSDENVTIPMERKLGTKYTHVFLKIYKWTTLGPAQRAKTLASRAVLFPVTPKLKGLFHTCLNTLRILSLRKAHILKVTPKHHCHLQTRLISKMAWLPFDNEREEKGLPEH